ncbi:ATP-binding cassette domain-containing protein [Modestobacter italicus]|uniref:ATP-binding cassette domain-containing protein n=1 Tax=Modestobacter italicus (strain DSM 44449 / CECT 9708 / BC 501) TaxID=2732864 RepID=UPI001C93B440|nr:ATP-binding cassette domain-containing protein [Modestobacter italicus]
MNALTVRLAELSVRRGPTLALADVDAAFPAGSTTALVGHNGSGKSTLLDVLAGALPATGGRVTGLAGVPVAYVPQHSAVTPDLPITVGETIAMGRWRERGLLGRLRPGDRAVVAECAALLGLTALLAAPLSRLSGGQRQRALVAQGLAARAAVLLVDEPTAGVDDATRRALLAALGAEAARGAVVVHATHDEEAIARADHVLALRDGRVDVRRLSPVGPG